MDRDARVRACYQHCALKWVMSERMTNQSLRERFHLEEGKAAVASQVIAATIGAGLIKPDERRRWVAEVCPLPAVLGLRLI